MTDRPLLMIPGPVEVSPAVLRAFSAPPPGHTSAPVIEAFGTSLERMRRVWAASEASQPFAIAGGGTAAMEMAVANLIEPGDRALVVNTGYFSDRIAEMLRRQGAAVVEVGAPVGDAPGVERVREALEQGHWGGPWRALFATHVDTSTGVRIDPRPLAALAREQGILSVFDGVCATAGELFDMAGWQADVYLTASQKALGLPPGLALQVASPRALAVRAARKAGPPPLYLDWDAWRPVMEAYEERRPSYFSTPATNLILALEVGLGEILEAGLEARLAAHERAARAMRAAWRALGLELVPVREELAANTLSALRLPAGLDATFPARVLTRGVAITGGLHPALRTSSFRIGHMGYAVDRPDWLRQTAEAVGEALRDSGIDADPDAAGKAVDRELASP